MPAGLAPLARGAARRTHEHASVFAVGASYLAGSVCSPNFSILYRT